MSKELQDIVQELETGILDIVGEEFAPKQEGGSPERKRLLGLIGKTYFCKEEAIEQLETFISSETKKAIREYIEPHLDYCQEQNGGSYCKNCRLSYERLDELEGEL
jgi:hypothetical protein